MLLLLWGFVTTLQRTHSARLPRSKDSFGLLFEPFSFPVPITLITSWFSQKEQTTELHTIQSPWLFRFAGWMLSPDLLSMQKQKTTSVKSLFCSEKREAGSCGCSGCEARRVRNPSTWSSEAHEITAWERHGWGASYVTTMLHWTAKHFWKWRPFNAKRCPSFCSLKHGGKN